ncbi:MAG: sugar O-acetyltransferase [Lachnospiraceae bacterium]|nr:sugar O-acetyltransferase [Lachnospiraceae bacterium]
MVNKGEYKLFNNTTKKYFWTMLSSEFLNRRLNKTPLWFVHVRNWLIKLIVAHIDGTPLCVTSPVYFQQGNNTYIGKNFFCNYNCKFLDHGGIYIGDDVWLAPDVTITTVSHSLIPKQRNIFYTKDSFEPNKRNSIEINKPVHIGNSVWIATKTVVCSGVTIGDNTVIGAGSVVTRDIPSGVFACGSPCRVVRKISAKDKVVYKKELF